ncbi:hypothetical protein RRG08_005201 [Elysia crispata]|uniref:Uncharacterized protein n=1 Tax=Elysia crispata TaxID=231223 RepID=A0AAE0YH67_9GAST|nr:hypothetical protein RRG08_005201 [Elysia crispata]
MCIDDFYSRSELFAELHRLNDYEFEIVQRNRKNYPADKRDDINMLSSLNAATMTIFENRASRKSLTIQKPTPIIEYCKFMEDVDLADQICLVVRASITTRPLAQPGRQRKSLEEGPTDEHWSNVSRVDTPLSASSGLARELNLAEACNPKTGTPDYRDINITVFRCNRYSGYI